MKEYWTAVYDTIFEHPKTIELAEKLGDINETGLAVGILVAVWIWGKDNADRDGRINTTNKNVLAKVISNITAADPKNAVEALISCGWIDSKEDGMYLHDWSTWQGEWYKLKDKREKDRQRKTKKDDADEAGPRDESEGEPAPEGEGDPPPVPAPPDKKTGLPRVNYTPEYEELWKAYPKRPNNSKVAGYNKYRARLNEGYTPDQLMEAVLQYSAQVKREGTKGKYILHTQTFFGPSYRFADFLQKESPAEPKKEESKNPFDQYTRSFR